MPRLSDTVLKNRSRALLEAMTERRRWVYALPSAALAGARAEAEAAGMRVTAGVVAADERVTLEGDGFSLTLSPRADLEVMLLEGDGEGAVPVLSSILGKCGFFAQSQLLATAHDTAEPEAPEALATLATMVVSWDAEWGKLFALHLASAVPETRAAAARSLAEAAVCARAVDVVRPLLERALASEEDEGAVGCLAEALRCLR